MDAPSRRAPAAALALALLVGLVPALARAQRAPLPAAPALPRPVLAAGKLERAPARPAPPPALAVPPGEAGERGADLTVYVLTFGPGDHPFFKFGHNAIWIHDAGRGRDAVYNFGTFGFDSPWLILDFLKGRLRYWLSVDGIRATLGAYAAENRSVEAQELRLTPDERLLLSRALEENALPQNRYYKYDYYRDNCSTRVRDAIDRVIGGRLHAASGGPASMTWRDHTLRLTADDLPVYLGLDVVMGDFIDQPITFWDEMFLPEKLAEGLRRVTVPGPEGEVPLVRADRILVAADRPPERERPPSWGVPMAIAGLGLGGLVAAAAALATRRRWARMLVALLLGSYGLVAGLLGVVFVGMWAFTDHVVAYHNENILQLGPWALVLVVAAWRIARGRPSGVRLARLGLVLLAAGSLAGALGKALPWLDQANGEIIALALPLWATSLAGVALWERAERARSRSAEEDRQASVGAA